MPKSKSDEKQDLVPFLKRGFLFSGLSDERIALLADEFEVAVSMEGERLYSVGDTASYFYLVWEGKVQLRTETRNGRLRTWDTLIPGDYFGVELLLSPLHVVSAVALTPVRILRLERQKFMALLAEVPKIERLVRATAEARRMTRQENVKWLTQDEAVYAIHRKHEFFLMVYLFFPILLGVAAIPALVLGFVSAEMPLLILGILMLLFSIALGVWLWIDWRNDHYIVTSQRVLWLEKVILLYESRQEAPLSTVLSTNVSFNQILRALIDYGTLTVRTYTGSIVMVRTYKPGLLIEFIDGLRARAYELARRAEEEKVEDLLRQRLNLPPKARLAPVPAAVLPAVPAPVPAQVGPIERIFRDFFKVRFESGDTITYRKHWFVLLQKTWLQALILSAILLGLLVVWLNFPGTFLTSGLMLVLFWIPAVIIVFIWWLYHYVDWRNDIYVLTSDSIFDIDRKPLSREEKKSAPLSNILSMEHTREGILNLILNVGDVLINVGTAEFTFDGVYNPAQVQQEIFDRMYALRVRKQEADAGKERERIVNWITTYHRQVDGLENVEKDSDWDIFSG